MISQVILLINKKDSIISNSSEVSKAMNIKNSKVNIHSLSNAVLRERKQSEADIARNQSLPQLMSNASTSPETKKNKRFADIAKQASTMSAMIKKMQPVKHQSRKSRIQYDIFKWVMKKVASNSEEEFNPYTLKKALFDSSEENPM